MLDAAWIETVTTQPLSAEEPCGSDARFEEPYEALKAEVGKLESLSGEEVNWALVRRNGQELLAKTTKDLTLSAYFTVSLLQQGGLVGLRDGLKVIDGLARNFWEGLYPTRMRARRSALAWMGERCEALVGSLNPSSSEEIAALDEAFALVASLWEYSQPLLEEDPGLGGLNRALREKRAGLSAASEPESSDSAEASAGEPAATAPAASSGSQVKVEKKLETRADAYAKLREVADFLARIEPHSPVPLLLKRAMTWGDMGFEQVIMELIAKDKEATRRVREILGLNED